MGTENNVGHFEVHTFGHEQPPLPGPPRWDDCRDDVEVRDEWDQVLWVGPRYLRCTRQECHTLVTHGMIAQGGCWCGNRRLVGALRLTTEERALVKRGYYPLTPWEIEQVQPTVPLEKQPGWGHEEWKQRYA